MDFLQHKVLNSLWKSSCECANCGRDLRRKSENGVPFCTNPECERICCICGLLKASESTTSSNSQHAHVGPVPEEKDDQHGAGENPPSLLLANNLPSDVREFDDGFVFLLAKSFKFSHMLLFFFSSLLLCVLCMSVPKQGSPETIIWARIIL